MIRVGTVSTLSLLLDECSTALTVEQYVSADKVNALTADGVKFAHPLQHLGKTTNDLPVIAIDSFKHMYLFKHDVKTQLGCVVPSVCPSLCSYVVVALR